jgi:hypothetical protein
MADTVATYHTTERGESMSIEELRRYAEAQAEAIENAHKRSGSVMALDAFAILWVHCHAETFRAEWPVRMAA